MTDEQRANARQMVDWYRAMDNAERSHFDAACDRVNATTGDARRAARLEAEGVITAQQRRNGTDRPAQH